MVASPPEPSSGGLRMESTNTSSMASNLLEPSKEVIASESTTDTQQTPAAIAESSADTSQNAQPIAKKRTLTAAEKAEARAKKDAEVQRKAEEKARREEAKRQKEEEKRQKEEEKQQKQDESRREKEEKQKVRDAAKLEKEVEKKAKDALKAEKEAEKKAKEEAQAKKDKSQLRLGAFFKKPPMDTIPSGTSSRRSSIVSIEVDAASYTSVGATDGLQAQSSEYEKTFPPFFLHAHTELAPITLYPIDEARASWALNQIKQGKSQPDKRPDTILGKRKRSSYMPQPAVKKLLLQMQGLSAANPIDLEKSKLDSAAAILKTLPVKFLKFREDVRPPWIGTYSRAPQGRKFAALCRNPFRKTLPDVNYDYDSEAEWEEPEEGEDLNSEGEEDEEDEDEDMGEFLDDEAAEALPKRKQLVSDLEPIYTDLNWEGPVTKTTAIQFGALTIDLQTYRLATLLDTPTTLPIDPFSTSYWTEPISKAQPKTTSSTDSHPRTRIPLNTIKGLNQSLLNPKPEPNSKPSKPTTAAKPLPPELMSDFKKAVSGSNLSKLGLIEVLKKDFPQITKKTVEQTLLLVAKRVGKKESEKIWQIIE